ncbi:helix-turn-helix transcriptional regulator [Adlercreutzia sp. R21]|uniref:helix-turn-helix transcriptional regulator n=1 Tax=Adlercreutzia wanghongyangiae TaxID=3111451 RepID=UPI002DBF5438|nr:helix-turn-helix transcriptional regulator [Adlercreutzia sp. R21]MEC4185037.1 helix-turn-helix transcriptional regulator [Adlercreutzia sp. R21]
MDDTRARAALARAAMTIGLGLCWASEELVSFCVAGFAGLGPSGYLYAAYLPLLGAVGAAIAIFPRIGDALAHAGSRAAALLLGVFGMLVLALFPQQAVIVVLGVALYAIGVAVVNIMWMRFLVSVSAQEARRAIVATAVVTTLALPLWQWGNEGVLLAATVLLALSVGASCLVGGMVGRDVAASSVQSDNAFPLGTLRRWAAPLGVCVLMMGFGFLQYTVYHYGMGAAPSHEGISHGLAIVLLIIAVYGGRDSEPALGLKMATTLMLFSFVLLAVLSPRADASAMLAAATEGMLELIVLLALIDLIGARSLNASRVFGCYLVLVAATQLVGCGLAVLDHTLLPSASYSGVGLGLVALFIITAVWLLNDKTITAFLWEDRTGRSTEDDVVSDKGDMDETIGQSTFEERARAVAESFSLTARETEVMALFAKGRSSSFIAEAFCVSNNTIRSHILHLYAKCDVHSRQELITLIDTWES